MDFEPSSRRMRLRGLQSGVSVEHVQRQTGFDLLVTDDLEELAPPSPDELEIYRTLRDGLAVSQPATPALTSSATVRPV